MTLSCPNADKALICSWLLHLETVVMEERGVPTFAGTDRHIRPYHPSCNEIGSTQVCGSLRSVDATGNWETMLALLSFRLVILGACSSFSRTVWYTKLQCVTRSYNPSGPPVGKHAIAPPELFSRRNPPRIAINVHSISTCGDLCFRDERFSSVASRLKSSTSACIHSVINRAGLNFGRCSDGTRSSEKTTERDHEEYDNFRICIETLATEDGYRKRGPASSAEGLFRSLIVVTGCMPISFTIIMPSQYSNPCSGKGYFRRD